MTKFKSGNREKIIIELTKPTEDDLKDELFNGIWEVIQNWDIEVPRSNDGRTAASGAHAKIIFDAVKKILKKQKIREILK